MQPVATGGKWRGREDRSNRRKPLLWVATGCLSRSMVRRGSTVRVRQRALVREKYPEIGYFCCLTQHHRAPPQCRRAGYSARLRAAKPLQIDLLPGTSEHLPETEGLDVVVVASGTESRWKEDVPDRATWAHEAWGQVLGTGLAVRTELQAFKLALQASAASRSEANAPRCTRFEFRPPVRKRYGRSGSPSRDLLFG